MSINHNDSTIIPLLREYVLEQHKHSNNVKVVMDECERLFEEGSTREQRANAMQVVEDYVNFIMSESGKFIISYRKDAKVSALKDLNLFLSQEDCLFHAFMSLDLEQRILDALDFVNVTPFVRDLREVREP
jgi:hypothetical protein